MAHWNGNQLCAIDCETTGLDPLYDEILTLAIIPLTSNIEPRKDVMPLHLLIQPEYPERIKEEAMKVNKIDLAEHMSKAFDKETALNLFEEWQKKLGLPYSKYGKPKKITPLGQNYLGFDKGFIQQWMGLSLYDDYFDYHCVDTMVAANYINDRAAFHGEPHVFNKVNLGFLATTLKVPHDRAHDALEDARVCAAVYREMLKMGPLLL